MHTIKVTALALALSGCARGQATESPKTEACDDFELDVARSWNDQTRVSIKAQLLDRWGGELGVEAARQRAESVVTSMDQISADWVRLRRAACLDYFKRGLGTAEAYQARAGCLDRALERQRAVVTSLEGGDDAVLTALGGLSDELARCGDAATGDGSR
ncbi:MAG: hypothetical protein R3A51_15460 [Nannocystaceae bacterium]|nr:hypothetical protein [Myxococcales bacterium]